MMEASRIEERTVSSLTRRLGNDPTRMLEIVRSVQAAFGHVSPEAMEEISSLTGAPLVEIRSVVSFYAFYSERPMGRIVIRLCDDVVDHFAGAQAVAQALEDELGIRFGETTGDAAFSLEWTPCIGLSDQAPAAMVDEVMVTELTPESARGIVRELRRHGEPARLVHRRGEGNNADPRVNAMVRNNIRRRGPVIFSPFDAGAGLRAALATSPAEVIRALKTARLRGRGGAGFPTGMKWEFTRKTPAADRVVVCNADEGEPGTFKDRVILTEQPELLFDGMTVAGYALGASEGVIYLRGEYAYLYRFLEDLLRRRREAGLLGRRIAGREDFHFDIRIQLGAGSYVCGEETALLNSLEALRGDPRDRPPYPAEKGLRSRPTVVNNVETLCCVARIMEKGATWFAGLGSAASSGCKLLSVSGDCAAPGVYEVPFGIRLAEVLELAGAESAAAVQVGGPSGTLVGPKDFGRTLCFDDLTTGGALMIFGPERDLLEVAQRFASFFAEESCGHCVPCRVGSQILAEQIGLAREGRIDADDLERMQHLARTMTTASRCGLGQTASRPLTTSLESFPELWQQTLSAAETGRRPAFDPRRALAESRELTGRDSRIYPVTLEEERR